MLCCHLLASDLPDYSRHVSLAWALANLRLGPGRGLLGTLNLKNWEAGVRGDGAHVVVVARKVHVP